MLAIQGICLTLVQLKVLFYISLFHAYIQLLIITANSMQT